MKASILRLLAAAMLAGLVPGMALAAESNELYLKRFSLYGWVGGGGGSQTLTIEHIFGESEPESYGVYGVHGGGGFAYNHLFTPNLRIGLELQAQYLSGTLNDATIGTTTVVPKLMLSYIIVTPSGGFEPSLSWGTGWANVCESGDNIHEDCDVGLGGDVAAGIYWTPPSMRWLSVGALFQFSGSDSFFGSNVETYMGTVNARFQYNFGK